MKRLCVALLISGLICSIILSVCGIPNDIEIIRKNDVNSVVGGDLMELIKNETYWSQERYKEFLYASAQLVLNSSKEDVNVFAKFIRETADIQSKNDLNNLENDVAKKYSIALMKGL